MNKSERKTTSATGHLAAIAFFIISVIFFPVTLVGYVIFIAYLYLTGRKSGVSTTAQGPLSARWFQHFLGVLTITPV